MIDTAKKDYDTVNSPTEQAAIKKMEESYHMGYRQLLKDPDQALPEMIWREAE